MNEEEVKEAKLVALSMAKIKEFCMKSNECQSCPLCSDPEKGRGCHLGDNMPNGWDVDQSLYKIGFYAGRREA